MRASSLQSVMQATRDVEIFDPRTQANVDMPFVRWVMANRNHFYARMPLSVFLRCVPNWLLDEVLNCGHDSEATPAAVFLSFYFEGLWGDPIGRASGTMDEFADWAVAFTAACAFEAQRRSGFMRWTVDGPDRLRSPGNMTLELNPAIMHLVRGPVPQRDDDSAEARAFVEKLIAITLQTDWADLGAYHGD